LENPGQMSKVKVAILGATGYTALEVIEILLRHPQAEIVAATSRSNEPASLAEIHPRLNRRISLATRKFNVSELVSQGVSTAFSCLPHGASADSVRELMLARIRVIDLSADYRLRNPDDQMRWYGHVHRDIENLEHAVYGLPEFYQSRIKSCRLAANPGCYPQTVILGMAPLLRHKIIEPESIIADCKSGISGAGRTPSIRTHFPECNESVSAYQLGVHRHTAEIEQELAAIACEHISVLFLPHLVPMERGILATITAKATSAISTMDLQDLFRMEYADSCFVRVCDDPPCTSQTRHTNFIDIHVQRIRDRIVVVASIDNLVRGASGVAVQNFNIMHGFIQSMGLLP